jgi:murein DD-endopeptidase MepM/ murein hydrolase activator NlpD
MMDDHFECNTIPKMRVQARNFPLMKNISVPIVLLFVLLLGFLSGTGLYLKSIPLAKQFAWLDSDLQNGELQSLRMSNKQLKSSNASLEEQTAELLDSAVADLNNKSRTIESLLDSIGVDLQFQVGSENSGGPFTSYAETGQDELNLRSDQYLDAILNVPLGAPVPGEITSKFGRRIDPINGRPAYHKGVDIRGHLGSEIKATANGVVIDQKYDKVNGRHIMLDHGNGFVTKYAHLKRSLVQKGDTVEKGQIIGLVGTSGRSTGPHLHYEIYYENKIVNPTRFVMISKHLIMTQMNYFNMTRMN